VVEGSLRAKTVDACFKRIEKILTDAPHDHYGAARRSPAPQKDEHNAAIRTAWPRPVASNDIKAMNRYRAGDV